MEKIFAETKQAFGRQDILVNNAGVYNLLPLEEVTEEDFHRHFNINVLGLLLAAKEAASPFGEEGGSIINIGSVVNDINSPNSVVYTATKGAVDAVTRVLAKELGPRKIRVNAIKPGLIDTEGTHAMGFIGSDYEKQKTLTEDQVLLIAKALSDRHRYAILKRLGEHSDALACGAVRTCTGISPATLSHHMKELEIAGLVEVVRAGKFASYVLRRDVLEAFFQRLRDDLT